MAKDLEPLLALVQERTEEIMHGFDDVANTNVELYKRIYIAVRKSYCNGRLDHSDDIQRIVDVHEKPNG